MNAKAEDDASVIIKMAKNRIKSKGLEDDETRNLLPLEVVIVVFILLLNIS